MNSELLRKLPKIDELLNEEKIMRASEGLPRSQVKDALRKVIDEKRKLLLNDHADEEEVAYGRIVEEAVIAVTACGRRSLRRVINGTGVVLHTNLGRARLSRAAIEAVCEAAGNYSTLEYDPAAGCRGSRHDHVESVITRITGAEAAMVVNNNAAATMLCLAALGKGREIIISRGELVEIGGSFRIPEIMEESGAFLREVGTTNKTKYSDYEENIGENTGALLKVHTSNYKIIGFTEEVSLQELKQLAQAHHLPLIYDMGSGLLAGLEEVGIGEPTVREGLAAGADVILFSGDKLLGGPQGGVIAGKKTYIEKMKRHPLARVLRVDKMTLAAMEATFRAYYDEERAMREIPVLSMLTKSGGLLEQEARELKRKIEEKNLGFDLRVEPSVGKVGGGSAPAAVLEGYAVSLSHGKIPVQIIEAALREGELPVIVRVSHDRILIDPRTMTEREQQETADKLEEIVKEKQR